MIDIQRSQPPPESLAEGKSYRGEDVNARLLEDFLRKCYLCEGTLIKNFDVEHRHPLSAGGGEYDWNNLFPAHHSCNKGRPAYPPEGLLSPGEGVEQRLLQWLDTDRLPCFSSVDPNDVLARNTAAELDHIHRTSTDAADELRRAIVDQLARVLELANQLLFMQLYGEGGTVKAREVTYELRCKVNRDAPFSVLIRSKLPARLLESLR